jgi:gamma-carbonic anhydrase
VIRSFQNMHPLYDDSNFIASTAEVIGEVRLGRGASVWFNATVRADVNWITIGEATNIQDNAVVHVTTRTAPTSIGSRVTVGHSAVIHGCTIEDKVLVGIGAILLDNAVIGSETIIGAGALVTPRTVVPPRSLVLGTPARVIRSLRQEEIEGILRHAENYLRYAAAYQAAANSH